MSKVILSKLLMEDPGNLAGMPKHAIKLAVQRGGGRNSTVTKSEPATSHHRFKKHLNDALKHSAAVAVHANGKHVATVHTNDDYTAKQKYGITHADGSQHTTKVTHYPKRSHFVSGRHGEAAYRRAKPRYSTNSYFSKGDAVDLAISKAHAHVGETGETGKDSYKNHEFTVHAVSHDDHRAAVHDMRKTARGHDRYSHGHSKTVVRKGDEKILDRAAGKMASRYVGSSNASKEAASHHSKIGEMISKGEYSKAREHLSKLDNHLRGASRAGANKESVKSDIKALKGPDYHRKYALERLRKLNEDVDLVSEISNSMKNRYLQKANFDIGRRTEHLVNQAKKNNRSSDAEFDDPKNGDQTKKLYNRYRGVDNAHTPDWNGNLERDAQENGKQSYRKKQR